MQPYTSILLAEMPITSQVLVSQHDTYVLHGSSAKFICPRKNRSTMRPLLQLRTSFGDTGISVDRLSQCLHNIVDEWTKSIVGRRYRIVQGDLKILSSDRASSKSGFIRETIHRELWSKEWRNTKKTGHSWQKILKKENIHFTEVYLWNCDRSLLSSS